MPIDLSGLIPVVDDLMMTDECLIRRDTELTSDDTWDNNTGTYTKPAGDLTDVYQGSCSVWSRTQQPTPTAVGAVPQVEFNFFLGIPLGEEVEILPEDQVTITSSQNPNLEGRVFLVEGEVTGTFDVHRMIQMREYSRVPGA